MTQPLLDLGQAITFTLCWGGLFQPIPSENRSPNFHRGGLSLYCILSHYIPTRYETRAPCASCFSRVYGICSSVGAIVVSTAAFQFVRSGNVGPDQLTCLGSHSCVVSHSSPGPPGYRACTFFIPLPYLPFLPRAGSLKRPPGVCRKLLWPEKHSVTGEETGTGDLGFSSFRPLGSFLQRLITP